VALRSLKERSEFGITIPASDSVNVVLLILIR